MENRKKPGLNGNKESLITALLPLSDDYTWINSLIAIITTAPLIESDFEISGLARKIAYEMIKENPVLFTEGDTKTLPLRNLINHLNSNINVLKNRKENITKAIEDAYKNNKERKKDFPNQSKL